MNEISYAALPKEFGEAVKTCFAKYFDFSGRASRSEYWWFFLFYVVLFLVIELLFLLQAQLTNDRFALQALANSHSTISMLFTLATFFPWLTVSCRRLHDIGRSGWWLLLGFTLIGIIPLIIMVLIKGRERKNKYDLVDSG